VSRQILAPETGVGTEMKVTEIILAKVSRLGQLSSHSHGFLSYRFLNPLGLAYEFLWRTRQSYDLKMLLKVVFDKTALVKFKISKNFKQNIDETHSKQPKIHKKIHTCLWILKIFNENLQPSLWICILCDFHLGRGPNCSANKVPG
jgi:hypothetical protein